MCFYLKGRSDVLAVAAVLIGEMLVPGMHGRMNQTHPPARAVWADSLSGGWCELKSVGKTLLSELSYLRASVLFMLEAERKRH